MIALVLFFAGCSHEAGCSVLDFTNQFRHHPQMGPLCRSGVESIKAYKSEVTPKIQKRTSISFKTPMWIKCLFYQVPYITIQRTNTKRSNSPLTVQEKKGKVETCGWSFKCTHLINMIKCVCVNEHVWELNWGELADELLVGGKERLTHHNHDPLCFPPHFFCYVLGWCGPKHQLLIMLPNPRQPHPFPLTHPLMHPLLHGHRLSPMQLISVGGMFNPHFSIPQLAVSSYQEVSLEINFIRSKNDCRIYLRSVRGVFQRKLIIILYSFVNNSSQLPIHPVIVQVLCR